MKHDLNHRSQSSHSGQSSQSTSSHGHVMPNSSDCTGQESNCSSISHVQNQSTDDLFLTGSLSPKTQDAKSTYLDQVKYKFEHQPQVYYEFLCTLKMFDREYQETEVAGLIEKAGSLFCEYPELILGLNPFLPPGYEVTQIEPSQIWYPVDGEMSYLPTNEPSGPSPTAEPWSPPTPPASSSSLQVAPFQTEGENIGQIIQAPTPSFSDGGMSSPVPVAYSQYRPSYGEPNHVGSGFYEFLSPRYETISPPPDEPLTSSCPDTTFTSVVEPPISSTYASPLLENEFPCESVILDLAVTYVNKIKERFHDQPEMFSRFLEIMNRYKNQTQEINIEQSTPHIETFDVYSKIAILFQNHDDLREEFRKFLPPPDGQAPEPVSELPKKSVRFALPIISVSVTQSTPPKVGRLKSVLKKNSTPSDQSALKTTDGSNLKKRKSLNKRAFAALHPDFSNKSTLATPNKDIPATEAPQHAILEDSAFVNECHSEPDSQRLKDFVDLAISLKDISKMTQPHSAKQPETYQKLRKFLNRRKEQATREPVSRPQLILENPNEHVSQPQLTPKRPKRHAAQSTSPPEKPNDQPSKRSKQCEHKYYL